MAKESEKMLDEVHEIEKDIHFYKSELIYERPAEYVHAVHKLLSKAEEKKRSMMAKVHQLEHREDAMEKKNEKKN